MAEAIKQDWLTFFFYEDEVNIAPWLINVQLGKRTKQH